MLTTLCVLLLFACGYDYLQNRIPNRLLLLMLAAGVGWNGMLNGFPAALMGAARTAAVMLALYPLFKIGCIGAGDVKLLGICAGFLPAAKIWIFLFVSLLVSAIFFPDKNDKGMLHEGKTVLSFRIFKGCNTGRQVEAVSGK